MQESISQFFKAIGTMGVVQFSIFMVAIIAAMWIYFVKRNKGNKDDSNNKKESGDLEKIRGMLKRDNREIADLKDENEELHRAIEKLTDSLSVINKEVSEISGMLKVLLSMKQ